jgi:serine-type D-Ala-D-Ala carboxypeptidase/endopeptidase (penicillin-binding protein 4)
MVESPPIATLARLALVPSDNLIAEMLLKDVGAQFGTAGSTTAGAAVVRRTLAPLGVRPRIADGSGLSRANATSPRQVVTLLNGLRANPALRAAMPVAGRSGTLVYRMRGTSAQDRCQAKTGTLSNVSALAGYCRTPNGHTLAFAFLQNYVYTPTAKAAEDRLTIRLAQSRPAGIAAPPATPTPVPAGGGAAPAS